MFEEYLHRTFFVFLHGGLLLLYLFLVARSYLGLRREQGALDGLARDWEAAHAAGEAGTERRLARLQEALESLHPTALRRQLRAVVGTTTVGEDFDTQRVLAQLGRSLAANDDVIRFCINGLVIVGLMGTLYAFYEMWGSHGAANLTAANSTLYLESMSTALLVSLVGLILALVTNFLFSLLRASRQSFLERVAAFLVPVAALLPTDAKTHLLLTNLLAPLNRLVEQITLQNDHVLRGLTDAVNTRTEQLNGLIEKATAEWQASIGVFRAETLTAVDSMQRAASRLADSSLEVAETLREVGESLERTKDIGRIVGQLETSSGLVVATLAGRLDAATDGWAKAYNRAAQGYEAAMRQQAETASRVSREVIGMIRDDLSSLVTSASDEFDRLRGQVAGSLDDADARLAATLDAFAGKFAGSIEALAARWMTEASAATDETAAKLERLVNGWQAALDGTAHSVNSTLADSRELIRGTAQNVSALSADLNSLQAMVRAASEKEGAPVYMGQAVERLGEVSSALADLAAKLEYGRAINQLQEAVAAGRADVGRLAQQVAALDDSVRRGRPDEEVGALGTRLDRVDAGVSAVRAELSQLTERINAGSHRPAAAAPPPPPPHQPQPSSWWQRVTGGHRRGDEPPESSREAYESDYNRPGDDER